MTPCAILALSSARSESFTNPCLQRLVNTPDQGGADTLNGNRTPWRTSPRQGIVLVAVLCLGVVIGRASFWDTNLSRLSSRIKHGLGLTEASPPGHWNLAQTTAHAGHLSAQQKRELDRLRSLGYASGTVPAADRFGVTACDPQLVAKGLRYYTSGHTPAAYLMNQSGQVLHRWQMSYQDCIEASGDRGSRFAPDKADVTSCWRRARLLDHGDLLAIYEGHGLIKLDRDSRLLWSYPGGCHHDLDVAADGSIYVLTREAHLVPRLHPDQPVLLDFVTKLDADGRELDRLDLLKAFEDSPYAGCLAGAKPSGDIFHTNTLELLDGSQAHRSPVFAAGNLLISVRELNTIAIVDPRSRQVVWALSGLWVAQHQPTLLANGNLLVFDNQGHGGRSKVIEFDPFTQQIVWEYCDGAGSSLYSKTCGSCQRLEGGNTLITESDNGRAIEVDRDGRIVWEFVNTRRTGPDNELIAAIMEMVCLPADTDFAWLAPQ